MVPSISTFTVFAQVNFTSAQLATFLEHQNELSINSFTFSNTQGLIHIVVNNPDTSNVTVNGIAGFADTVSEHFDTFAELQSCTFV